MSNYKLSHKHGSAIDHNDAKKWMKKYKEKHPDGIHAYFFGSEIIRKIIDHPEAVGMRVFLAYGDDDKTQMVLIGAREDGSSILPEGGKDSPGGTVGDTGTPCPPFCP